MTVKRLKPIDWVEAGSEGSTTDDAISRITLSGEDDIVPIAYGYVELPGKITITTVDDDDNLILAVVWCVGEIDSINNLYINDDAPSSQIEITHYRGTRTQGIDPTLSAAISGFSDKYIYSSPDGQSVGIAYSVIKIPPDIVSGFPRFKAHILGRKVFHTGAVSNNPAYVLADLISDPIVGLGRTVDTNSLSTLVNDCAQQIGGKKRRTIGLVLSSPQNTERWVETLRVYAGCTLSMESDKVKMTSIWGNSTVVANITDNDVIKGSMVIGYRQQGRPATVITCTYTDISTFPYTQNEVRYVPSDVKTGILPWREERLNMPGIPYVAQAYREAEERYRALYDAPLTATWRAFDDGVKFSVGDLVSITHSLGLLGQKFRIVAIDVAEVGRWTIHAEQFDSAVRSNSNYWESPVDPVLPPNADLRSITDNPPSNVTLTEKFSTDNVQPPHSKFEATWSPVISALLARYEAQYSIVAGEWGEMLSVAVEKYTSPKIQTPVTIAFRVRAVATDGTRGPWGAATLLMSGRNSTLSKPTSVRVTGSGFNGCFSSDAKLFSMVVRWTYPIGDDTIVSAQVYANTYGSTSGAWFVTEVARPGDRYLATGLSPGQTFYWFIRFRDTNGNLGPWYNYGGVQGAASCRADQILDYLNGQIQQSQLHQSLITKIDSSLKDGDPAIVEMQQKIDDTYGEWTIKVQSGNVVAGIGLMADAKGDAGVRSAVIVRADRFAVGGSGVNARYPFIVENGWVYLSRAAIGNAWIENAKIKNLAVTNIKIGNNAATSMVAAYHGRVNIQYTYAGWGPLTNITPEYHINFSQAYAIAITQQVQVHVNHLVDSADGWKFRFVLRLYLNGATVLREISDTLVLDGYTGPGYGVNKEGFLTMTLEYVKTHAIGTWGTGYISARIMMTGIGGLKPSQDFYRVESTSTKVLLAKK